LSTDRQDRGTMFVVALRPVDDDSDRTRRRIGHRQIARPRVPGSRWQCGKGVPRGQVRFPAAPL